MGTHSPLLLKHPARSVATALSLFLLLLCSCYCSLSSAFLTLLVLAFSTCSLSLFSDLRRLREADSAAMKPSPSLEQEEEEESSKKSASETDRLTRGVDESSEGDAISDDDDDDDDDDDESLIEIALPEGIYADDHLSEFSPESVLKRNGLMDLQLLAEISEEDNLIEIDIARGSIKCSSRLGIKA